MTILTVEEIIFIHSNLITASGGLDGLRDVGLLESAVSSATTTFGNFERYPTIEEKAARLAYAIGTNHAFLDGNKRIAILTMLMTLKLNNSFITYSQSELISLGLSIACGQYKYDDIYTWILHHK